jgi:very-short-patch-repair endonuclease
VIFPETAEDRIPHAIRAESCSRSVDLLIAWFAERQWGLVAVWQLAACGVDRGCVARRIARGQLIKILPGAYAVGHRGWGKDPRRLAAVLSVGPEARLGGLSACANWGLIADDRAKVDVVTTVRGRATRAGVVVHRVADLDPRDTTIHDGKPTVTVARAVLDAGAEPDDIEEMLEQSLVLQLYDQTALDDTLARHRGRRGAGILALVLGRVKDDPDELRSKLERKFRALVRRYRLPAPSYNHRLGRSVFDAFYAEPRIAIELDSRRWHERKQAFDSDRRRDRRNLTNDGVKTMRLTWKDVVHDADGVAADIARLTTPGATPRPRGRR